MPYPIDQDINTGAYVNTTNVWDVAEIQELKNIDENFKDLLVRLYQNLNIMSEVLNIKDSAYYLNQQFVSGQLYFNPANPDPLALRPGFRVVIDTGALGAGVNTINLPFTIPAAALPFPGWTFFFIHGSATNTTIPQAVPLPFAGATGNNIEVIVNATAIVITNNSGLTFDRSNIRLEFVKN